MSTTLDPERVRAILLDAAREQRSVSYSEALGLLGHRFTRPLMRHLCKVLDKIDEDARVAGEPDLAVLVVRESDGMPGQGWWVARSAETGYQGAWEGPQARALIEAEQQRAFDYWSEK